MRNKAKILTAVAAMLATLLSGAEIEWFYTHPESLAVPRGEKPVLREIEFPAVPEKAEKIIVASFRMYFKLPGMDGWNYRSGVVLNRQKLGWLTRTGSGRFLNRGVCMKTAHPTDRDVPWIRNKDELLVLFGDGITPNPIILLPEGGSYEYLADISDSVNFIRTGLDGRVEGAARNSLGFINAFDLASHRGDKRFDNLKLVVDDIKIGYMDRADADAARPEGGTANIVPGAVAAEISGAGGVLRVHAGGGISMLADGETFFEDSTFSYPGSRKMEYSSFQVERGNGTVRRNKSDIELILANPFFEIRRVITSSPFGFHVEDTLVNLTDEDAGCAVTYKLRCPGRLDIQACRNCGLTEMHIAEGCGGPHPTCFAVSSGKNGGAIGIYFADDLMRNQASFLQTLQGFTVENRHLGFTPGAVRKLKRAFYTRTAGSYFNFINAVRNDFGLNINPVVGPFSFTSYDSKFAPKAAYTSPGPWLRYADATDTPRYTPEDYSKAIDPVIAASRRIFPEGKILLRLEANLITINIDKIPGGEILPKAPGFRKGGGQYGLALTPQQTAIVDVNTSYGDSLMRDAEGNAMVDTHYPAAPLLNLMVHFSDNNFRTREIISDIDYMIQTLGADGIYIDQFVPGCGEGIRNVGRSSFNRFDGMSVGLDEDGRISEKYYDYMLAGASARAGIIRHICSQGKTMFNNCHLATEEEIRAGSMSFAEMGCENVAGDLLGTEKPRLYRRLVQGQLQSSPLILSENPAVHVRADQNPEGFARIQNRATAIALRHGLLICYYHFSGVPPEKGAGGVIDHMYPLTPTELGEGFVVGKERIVSCVSRSFKVNSLRRPEVIVYNERGLAKTNHPMEIVPMEKGWLVNLMLRDWNEIAIINLEVSKY